MDNYLTIKQISEEWKIGERRINALCQEDRIPGAKKFGNTWAIPADAVKPEDRRLKNGKYVKNKEKKREGN